ncbi:MAG: hypothetical protein ACRD9R_05195 [Pyrinomonadaceae bacterium]
MFCPSCGEQTTVEQKFCRGCGTGLEKIWETLAEQASVGDQMTAETDARLDARARRIERWRDAALYLFFAVIFGAILWGVVYELMIKKGAFLTGLGFLIFLFAAAATAILSAHLDEVKEAKKKRGPASLPPEPTAPLLSESRIEPIPSVTERTTDLLTVERAARRRDTREV